MRVTFALMSHKIKHPCDFPRPGNSTMMRRQKRKTIAQLRLI